MLLKAEVVELASVWANDNEVFDVRIFLCGFDGLSLTNSYRNCLKSVSAWAETLFVCVFEFKSANVGSE